jgi:hypothetical protein
MRIDAQNAEIHLSQIFRWYSADFGTADTDFKNIPTLEFIYKHLDETTSSQATTKTTLKVSFGSGVYDVICLI